MLGVADPLDGDGPKEALAEAMAGALQTLLKQSGDSSGRVEVLQALRRQMNGALTEAPVAGDRVEAIALRARLGAVFDAECARVEAAETMQQPT